jgi:hypothetical protein
MICSFSLSHLRGFDSYQIAVLTKHEEFAMNFVHRE